ncbi:MAG: sulfatase-like hydrolase/transferase [Candidatus Hydrogenedentes bacterium]|nr:sulfatase-like hydrolase/transferase [Candidatus Hydrogenedentota bacterium]
MSDTKNVLLIIADQFRWDCLGAAGNRIIRTPNLDMLAAAGTLFTKAFVQTAPCGPSRMCIFTSRYMCSMRAVNNMTPLIDAEDTLPWYLSKAGAAPGFIGYNDYAVDPRILPEGDARRTSLSYHNFLPGFDVVLDHEYESAEWFEYLRKKGYPEHLFSHEAIHAPNVPPEGPGEHVPYWFPAHYKAEDSEAQFVTSTAIDYIRQRTGSGWRLSLNYIKPHPPRICPDPYHRMYDPADMPPPNRRPEELDDTHPYLQRMHREPVFVEERELRETQSNYYGMISELDACFGRLFQSLKDSGDWDNTLIIFTSDHGEYLGDHYFREKAHFYDETMRVPYIVRDPSPEADVTRGKQLDHFVEAIDTAPTILEYLGLPIPDRFQGKSVLGLVRGRADAQPKREIHFEFDFRGHSQEFPGSDPDEWVLWVLRDDEYKYVQFGVEWMPPMLFDLKADPGEFRNLAQEPAFAGVVARYCQKMLRWRMKYEDQRMEHWAFPLR